MKRLLWLFLFMAVAFSSCELKLKPTADMELTPQRMAVQRYDRLESRYLMTGDFSALQQMNVDFPVATRTLIEEMLKIGKVSDPEIHTKLLRFYQDTTLQMLVTDAEAHYAKMDDINEDFYKAFKRLKEIFPDVELPSIYAQIGALDQSIVVGENLIGISLDKYLGENYPLYQKYYSEKQRKSMNRENIVPDCLSFYLIYLFPLPDFENRTQEVRDGQVGKIQWMVNHLLERPFFKSVYVNKAAAQVKKNPKIDFAKWLVTADEM